MTIALIILATLLGVTAIVYVSLKYSCKHKWEELSRKDYVTERVTHPYTKVESTEIVLKCTEYGKIKKVLT